MTTFGVAAVQKGNQTHIKKSIQLTKPFRRPKCQTHAMLCALPEAQRQMFKTFRFLGANFCFYKYLWVETILAWQPLHIWGASWRPGYHSGVSGFWLWPLSATIFTMLSAVNRHQETWPWKSKEVLWGFHHRYVPAACYWGEGFGSLG